MRPAVVCKPIIPEEQHAAIRAELGRILSLPEFSGSKRCSDFLAYAVEQTLLGGQESELKERTIAVEVFGRPSTYDSNEDSIVRVTARDVRKRLAQRYLGVASDHAVRIDLPAGSYRADFHWPENRKIEPPAEAVATPLIGRPKRNWWPSAAVAAALAASFLLGWSARYQPPTVPEILQAFWGPVIQAPGPLLMCVGTPTVYDVSDKFRSEYLKTLPPEGRMQPFVIPFQPGQKVSGGDLVPVPGLYAGFGNVHTVADLVALMSKLGKPWQVRTAGDVSFAELRLSPAILIGGESNVWTQPLTTELRFYFTREGETMTIRDRKRPGQQWPAAGVGNGTKDEDFAIVSRVIDSKTDKCLIFVGGRTQSGTQAAGELVTHANLLAHALQSAPNDWARKNLQLVIRTQIHGVTSSAPTTLAAEFW
jgi:hypothetical protein